MFGKIEVISQVRCDIGGGVDKRHPSKRESRKELMWSGENVFEFTSGKGPD